jgi:hypothetical protein
VCRGVWGVGGLGGVGCCRVGSLLTFDIPQTALVATLDTYDFYFTYILCILLELLQWSDHHPYWMCRLP